MQTTSVVPRSGCFTISAAGIAIRIPGTTRSRSPTGALALRRASRRANSTIIASLASSDGCRLSGAEVEPALRSVHDPAADQHRDQQRHHQRRRTAARSARACGSRESASRTSARCRGRARPADAVRCRACRLRVCSGDAEIRFTMPIPATSTRHREQRPLEVLDQPAVNSLHRSPCSRSRNFTTTSRATGAAALPPWPPCSISTATTIRGSSAGA